MTVENIKGIILVYYILGLIGYNNIVLATRLTSHLCLNMLASWSLSLWSLHSLHVPPTLHLQVNWKIAKLPVSLSAL